MIKTMRQKPIFWIIGLALLLGVAGLFFYQQSPLEAEPAPIETAVAVSRLRSTNINATGKVATTQRAALSFDTPGRVESVPVRVGDMVAAGDVLVTLDSADREINLALAQQNLAIQEAKLAELEQGATTAELTAAEAAVASATAYLAQLQDGPRPAEIAVQNAELSVFAAQTWSATAALQHVNNSNSKDQIAAARAELAVAQNTLHEAREVNKDWKDEDTHRTLTQAEDRVDIAQSRLDSLLNGPNKNDQGVAQADLAAAAAQEKAQQLQTNTFLRGGTPEQISAAQAQLTQAQATLDTLQRGASAEQIIIAETAVSQAKLDVEAAQEALDKATLRAPFAGVITAVHVAEGSLASGPVIEMINPNELEVVLKVSEVDIGQLDVGQTVIVHTETWPTERLESNVTNIAPGNVVGDNRVNYEVRLALPPSENPIRVGMTAVAELIPEN